MKGWVTWFVTFTAMLGFFVAISPFWGWYTHLIWRAFNYGWTA